MNYIILALVKILDNIILTAKSITTYKEMKIISSILVVISQFIFYLVINQVVNDKTLLAITIVSVSSGIGNLIAFVLNDKFKKDSKWTMVITSSNVGDILKLCEYLTKHNVKHIANKGFTRKGKETIHVIAFSKNKNESRLIEEYLKTTKSKYLKERI